MRFFPLPRLILTAFSGVAIACGVAGCKPTETAPEKSAAVSVAEEPVVTPVWKERTPDARITNMDAICAANAAAEAPASDKPTTAEARALQNCLSTDFYYGVNGKRDLIKARKCAFVEYARGEMEGGYPGPYGAGVLMMLYAKGEGVKTNFPFATRMACEAGYAHYDVVMKLEEIEARKTDPKAEVDICSSISSSWLSGQCAVTEGHRLDQEREGRIARLQRGWPARRLAAWKQIETRRAAYENARIEGGEVDLSALLRTVYATSVENTIREQQEALLTGLVKGRLKSPESLAAADARLNRVYRELMADTSEFAWPRPLDLRDVQRIWLAYRNDWRAFAEASWPGRGDTVVALLTSARADALTCFTDDPPDELACW